MTARESTTRPSDVPTTHPSWLAPRRHDPSRRCPVPDCHEIHAARGFCGHHYRKWRYDNRDNLPAPVPLYVGPFGLSKAEEQIARLLALGLSNRQIADQRRISDGTLKNQITAVYRKLEVTTDRETIVKLRRALDID